MNYKERKIREFKERFKDVFDKFSEDPDLDEDFEDEDELEDEEEEEEV